MITPAPPWDEAARLHSLRALDILDSPREERFDRLTRMARRLFRVQGALISLVDEDRQWFKSQRGLEIDQTPRDISFCGHAILGDDLLLVPDALLDERFRDNPLVRADPPVRFYAGCPLRLPDGAKAGTLCLVDSRPRQLGEEDCQLLRDLAQMAEQEMAAVQLATTDDLTRLSNRRGFMTLGRHAMKTCARQGRPATLLFFDLDGFKLINDRFGHAEGDHALVCFSALLLQSFRESDVVARLGGDEFGVLMSDCGPDDAEAAVQRLRQTVELHNLVVQRGCELRFSAGRVSIDAASSEALETVIAHADALMYANKRDRQAAKHGAPLRPHAGERRR